MASPGSSAGARSGGPELTTERLVLRRWGPAHLDALADLHADPEVMATLSDRTLTRAESDRFARHQELGFEHHGHAMWAVELASGELIGAAGLSAVDFDAPFTPAVDVGWRLARAHWGHGYATEAARAAIGYGFDTLGLVEIVAFTSVHNARSEAVMRRLGMTRDRAGDFDHPRVPPRDPLRPHILYRLRLAERP
ncbi:MAG: GNAT family N-acetyltransferase [Acidimicrobiales bacterium]